MTKLSRLGFSQITGLTLIVVATLLVAADPALDPQWARLQAMPRGERLRLWENLQRFDRLKRSDQELARGLDTRINDINNPAQKAHYLGVLRRYHLWFESLPEAKRQELLKAPPDDRMVLVSKFISDQKTAVKAASPLLLLQIADIGSYSPVDVAMICKVWKGLEPAVKSEIEKAPHPQFRNQISRRTARANFTPEGLLPTAYKEADWVEKVERLRPPRQEPLTKAKVFDEVKRHLALNLYFLRNPPKGVADANLNQFLSQLPAAVRSTFDVFPPEEIRRRLSISYRLVYPDGEIESLRKPDKATASSSSTKPAPGEAARPVPSAGGEAPKPAGNPQTKPGNASALPF